MSSVDNRVVRMSFDNAQFENGVKTSNKSLEALKQGLNLDGAAKKLSNLNNVGKEFSLAGIASGIDTISNKFTALGIVGVTALANITNSAINTGKQLISSLTIDPISSGFEEYETKMNAIQTILTNTKSKGTTIDDVNAALAELNLYADQTIYNFAEMTKNIGTFTAAGIDLNTATKAIKGIANLAAGSGSNAEQASRAMYQLSQALSEGRMSLESWNSVTDAGMGGELFQNALVDKAVQMGSITQDLADNIKKGIVPFREAIKATASAAAPLNITKDMMTSVFNDFADNPDLIKAATEVKTFTQLIDTMKESVQSGWAQSWENIIGNKDEAAATLTAVNNAFGAIAGKSAEARNEVLSFWKANGGRDAIIQSISNVFKGLASILGPIRDAFREIFPPATGQQLVDLSVKIRDLTAKFVLSEETINNIKSTFKGLFAVLDIGVKIFKTLAGLAGMIIKAIFPGVGAISSLTSSFGDFLVYIDESIDRLGIMNKIFEFATMAIDNTKSAISTAIEYLPGLFNNVSNALGPILDYIKNIIGSIYDFFIQMTPSVTVYAASMDDAGTSMSKFSNVLTELKARLTKTKDIIVTIATTIKNVVGPVLTSLMKKFDELSMGDMGAILTGIGLIKFAKAISKGLSSIDGIISSVEGVIKSFSGVLDEVGNSLKAFQLKVKARALLNIAIALAILAAALIALSFINIEDLAKSLGAVTIMLVELVAALTIMNNKISKSKGISGQLMALGASMLLLAVAVKILASIDALSLLKSVTAMGALMTVMALFINITKGGSLKSSAGGLIGFAIGLTILVGALFLLGSMEPNKLIQGGVAIGTLMTMIALFVNLTKEGDLKKSAAGLTGFAIGITILTGALFILGSIDSGKLIQGTVAIGTLMTMIALFINLTKEGDLAKSAGGLIGFSVGITILTGALFILGSLDAGKLIQGTMAIGTLMTMIALFVNLTKGGDLAKSAGGLVGFSIGIAIMSVSLSMLAGIDSDKIRQGVTAIASLIGMIAVFIQVTKGGDLATSAAGLIGFSIGITILTAAVALLSAINPDKIVQGVGAIAALMTTIALFIKITKGGDLAESAGGLMGFAAGLAILAGTIAILSALDTDKLLMASTALGIMLVTLGVFSKLTDGASMVKNAIGLVAMSAGIWVLVQAMVPLASLDPKQIISSAEAIAIVMFSLFAFSKVSDGASMIKTALGLTAMSAGLFVLVQAMVPLASLDSNQIIASAGAIAIVLLSIIVFSKVASPAQMIPCAVGLLVFSGAIMVLSEALSMLGSISLKNLVKSIVALAAIFVILGVSALVLSPLTPVILALSAAIVLLGIGILSIGVGILAFANGMTVLASLGASGTAALVNTVTAIIRLIPFALITIAQGLIKFAVVIGQGAPQIAQAFMSVFLSIIDVIKQTTPAIIDCLTTLFLAMLNAIVVIIPQLVDGGMQLILGILKGISDNIAKVVAAGIDVILQFMLGISSKIPDIIDTAFKIIISFINGLADAINNNADAIATACLNLVTAIVNGISTLNSKFVDAGVNAVKGFIKGLASMPGKIIDAGVDMGKSALEALTGALDEHSPSKATEQAGVYAGEGLVMGMNKMNNKVSDAGYNMGDRALSSMSKAISGISDMVNDNVDTQPTIRPVMDLSDVTSGVNAMNSMFNKNQGITVSSANSKTSAINNRMLANNNQNGVNNSTNTNKLIDGTNTSSKPVAIQLVLQNGTAIAEYIVNDLDGMFGSKNQISGRMVGI